MNKVQREVFRRGGCFFLGEKVPASLPCLEVIARSCDNFSRLLLRISQNKGELFLVGTVTWRVKKGKSTNDLTLYGAAGETAPCEYKRESKKTKNRDEDLSAYYTKYKEVLKSTDITERKYRFS